MLRYTSIFVQNSCNESRKLVKRNKTSVEIVRHWHCKRTIYWVWAIQSRTHKQHDVDR